MIIIFTRICGGAMGSNRHEHFQKRNRIRCKQYLHVPSGCSSDVSRSFAHYRFDLNQV